MTWALVFKFLALLVPALTALSGFVYSVLRIFNTYQEKRDKLKLEYDQQIQDRLAKHCPAAHAPIVEKIDETKTAFGHEIGELKTLIIQNSPNGKLIEISRQLGELKGRLLRNDEEK